MSNSVSRFLLISSIARFFLTCQSYFFHQSCYFYPREEEYRSFLFHNEKEKEDNCRACSIYWCHFPDTKRLSSSSSEAEVGNILDSRRSNTSILSPTKSKALLLISNKWWWGESRVCQQIHCNSFHWFNWINENTGNEFFINEKNSIQSTIFFFCIINHIHGHFPRDQYSLISQVLSNKKRGFFSILFFLINFRWIIDVDSVLYQSFFFSPSSSSAVYLHLGRFLLVERTQ